MELVATKRIGDHLLIQAFDLSYRYYGDFHKIRILVRAQFSSDLASVENGVVVYETTLEQMGVPTADIPATKKRLVDTFIENTARYLLKPGFAEKCQQKKSAATGRAKGYFGNQ